MTEQLFAQMELQKLEAGLDDLLGERLPPDLKQQRLQVAIDLTMLPYHGADGIQPDQLRRGEAKAGITRFHAYATALVLQAGRRLTLALTFGHPEETLYDIVADLLNRFRRLDPRIERLYLDRDFASVAVLNLLSAQPFPCIVALPSRGECLNALLRGRSSYPHDLHDGECRRWPYHLRSVWVACRYASGTKG